MLGTTMNGGLGLGVGGGNNVNNGLTNQSLFEEAKKKLFNFNEKLDIGLLDSIVNCMYNATGEEQKIAQDILTSFKENANSWTRVDTILEYSTNQHTKYYALQILEQVIKFRWKSLPRVQCEGIRTFIVTLIIKTSQNPTLYDPDKIYLNKLNMILVQILKREWPKNWESFISEIVGSSKTNELLCQNNMVILKLLSEEVFDFSSGQLTQIKAKHLKDTMCSEFSQVFTLCSFVLENSQNAPLSLATLETLLRFLNWIPLGYIFETELINTLTMKYLPVPIFRNVTMKCLTEISSVTVAQYDEKFLALFAATMGQLNVILPPNINLREAYAVGVDRDQQFIQNLAMFLHTFLKEHGSLIEKQPDKGGLHQALNYLLAISQVDDVEIFKICFEYWNILTAELYREAPYLPTNTASFLAPRLSGGVTGTGSSGSSASPRRQFYSSILSSIRSIMISRMAKPEEVLVVENENGEVVREFMKDTDSINLYKNMRETLVYLTHLDCADTERIMTRKLQNQVNGTEWSWKNLNTLCWAIGSISGAMHEEDEKRFIVTVIKDLLGLCEQKKGKDNKAIIASNIMYVVGQYPRFLRAHWKFLKTVVNKLFEFMHETHDGVQDMACDTFIKIAQKCRRHFVSVQIGEVNPFIEDILATISTIICDLSPQQVHTFYEAVGYMISAQTDSTLQTALIEKYMQLPNMVWDDIILQAQRSGVSIFIHPEAIKQLCSILKTNVRACKALGHSYVSQLGRIYLDMMNVYKVIANNINAAIAENGELVAKQPLVKGMRVIKKETLKLVGGWIARSNDPELVLNTFIPALLEAIILDYSTSIPAVREPEALITLAAVVNKLETAMTDKISSILGAVFESTLSMISKDFEEYPEHRVNFYLLLQAINSHCFPAFLTIKPETFKLIYDCIIWGIQHTMRNVADTSLAILHQLLQNFNNANGGVVTLEQRQGFYQTYYLDVLKRLFSVLTDSSHSAGLGLHASILSYLFSIIDNGTLAFPISSTLPPNCSSADNVLFIKQYVASLLKSAFPHLTENQLKLTVNGMFNLDMDLAGFKEHLRDFLVQTREFSGQDDSDLFYEEREAALKQAEAEKRQLQMSVPGILNPHEIVEEMQD